MTANDAPSPPIDEKLCNICEKSFKTTNGLKIHNGRVHKVSNTKPCLNESTFTRAADSVMLPHSAEDTLSNTTFHEKLSSLKRSSHIMKRIPKSARNCSASVLCEIIGDCLQSNSPTSWENLLTFSYALFTIPHAKDSRRSSLTSLIKKNIKLLNSKSNVIPSQIDKRKYNQNMSKLVLSKIADGDIRSAIRILSSSDTLAEYNESTLSVLRSKHPRSDSLTHSLDSQPHDFSEFPVFQFSEHEVSEAIKSFRSGSAGGLDSFRPSHMQDLISHSSGNSGQKLLSSVTKLCNFIFTGRVPIEICPILFGASLCALRKKDGGVRPIAVGTFYRRLVAKLGCMRIKDELGSMLRPLQFGFGTAGGCEAVAHAARRYINLHPNPDSKIFLKIDFKNAFNMIDRNIMLHKVRDLFPGLYPFLSQCYKSASYLSFGEHTILSERGVQQGDPLGPALFCLTIDDLTRSLSSEFNCWYLDDGSIAGDKDIVSKDLEKIIDYSKNLGLELNFDKCELITLSTPNDISESIILKLAPGIKILEKSKWSLLGAPLSKDSLSEHLRDKRESLKLLTSRLNELPKHVAFFLLKNCLAIPKLMYALRCSPTWSSQLELDEFDNLLRNTTEYVTNNHFNNDSWLQATLPVNLGGLGLRSASSLALPAFLSSVNSVSDLIDSILPSIFINIKDIFYTEGESLWHAATKIAPPIDEKKIQRVWDRPLLNIITDKLLTSTSIYDKARLNAVMIKESGAWLNALPVASLGTLLDDESFRIAVGLRMGSSICVPHICVCGSVVDEKGAHGLSCRRSAGRTSRHHQVNDILKRALVSADIPAILEPLGTSRDDGKRPDGMSLIPWKYGKPVVWDFTCVDTVAASHLAESSKSAGMAALSGEKLKRKKYQNLGNNYLFHPVAVETFGVYGPESLLFVHELGRRLGQATKDYRSTTFLIERISIAIQRGNAASVLGTIPPSHNFDEIMHCPHFSTELKSLRNKPRYVSPIKVNSQVIDPHSSFSVRSMDRGLFCPPNMSCSPSGSGSLSMEELHGARTKSILIRNPSSLGRINCSLQNDYGADSYETVDSCPENLSKKLGLDNLGNTCYMNSILQVLFMTKNFKNEVLTMNENENVSYLFTKLKDLFRQLQFRKNISSFPPTDFLESLKSTRYSLGKQEDCSEFLGFLLNTLREQKNNNINIPDRSGLNDSIQSISSCVCRSFAGKILTCLRCSTCSRGSKNVCDFLELQLAFPDMSDNQSVQSLLLNHLKIELLTGDDQLYCQICTKLTDHYKTTSIAKTPANLIITLMLFKHDSTSGGSTKLLRKLEIDEHLNLADHHYNLHAVIIHYGSGVESGHYYSLVKDKTGWFKFDDSCVTKYSFDILNLLKPQETPYILFYEREDIGRSRSSDDVVLQVFPGFPAAEKANAPLESIKSPRSAN